jgi:hypothetical protein
MNRGNLQNPDICCNTSREERLQSYITRNYSAHFVIPSNAEESWVLGALINAQDFSLPLEMTA